LLAVGHQPSAVSQGDQTALSIGVQTLVCGKASLARHFRSLWSALTVAAPLKIAISNQQLAVSGQWSSKATRPLP